MAVLRKCSEMARRAERAGAVPLFAVWTPPADREPIAEPIDPGAGAVALFDVDDAGALQEWEPRGCAAGEGN
jgi:hypothetical protein